MRFVELGRQRVAFRVTRQPVVESEAPRVAPALHGAAHEGGPALVVEALDGDHEPLWAHVLRAHRGAALVCVYEQRLLLGLGALALLVDEHGSVVGRHDAGEEEFTGAWPLPQGLLLAGRSSVRLLGSDGAARWVAPLPRSEGAPAPLLLRSDGDALVLVVADGEPPRTAGDPQAAGGWREITLEARSGRAVTACSSTK